MQHIELPGLLLVLDEIKQSILPVLRILVRFGELDELRQGLTLREAPIVVGADLRETRPKHSVVQYYTIELLQV